MKALVKTEKAPGHLELLEVPEPECRPDQVKVEVKASGVCGTDIHILNDTVPYQAPIILGHEFSGVIVETGSDAHRARVGDRVVVLTSIGECCGTCRFCRDGHYSLCPTKLGLGDMIDGGFTKYVVVREELATPLPASVSFEVGALTEPMSCCVQAVQRGGVTAGDVVVVSGPGPMGLLVATLAKLQGGVVIVCGTNKDKWRLSVAREMGVDVTLNVEEEDVLGVVEERTAGYGADVVFECAGAASSARQCLNAVAVTGTYVQVGLYGKPITLDADTIINKHLTMLGNYGSTWAAWERTLRILADERTDVSRLITARMPLSAWQEAFARVQDKTALKVLLYPD